MSEGNLLCLEKFRWYFFLFSSCFFITHIEVQVQRCFFFFLQREPKLSATCRQRVNLRLILRLVCPFCFMQIIFMYSFLGWNDSLNNSSKSNTKNHRGKLCASKNRFVHLLGMHWIFGRRKYMPRRSVLQVTLIQPIITAPCDAAFDIPLYHSAQLLLMLTGKAESTQITHRQVMSM